MDKNKIFMIVIIVLLVLLLGAIGFVGYKAFSILGAEETVVEEEFVGTTEVLLPSEILTIPLDEPISTNLTKGEDGLAHDIRVSIAFGIDNRDPENEDYIAFLETFNANPYMLRSICLSIIKSKTYEEMSLPDAQDTLANEILIAMKDTFKSNYINTVYVSDWWVQ
ncbi:MAG: flagellar basal body-associated FliL family protein [Lachnospirales bacterium]